MNCPHCSGELPEPTQQFGVFHGLAHYVPPVYERVLWRGQYLDLSTHPSFVPTPEQYNADGQR